MFEFGISTGFVIVFAIGIRRFYSEKKTAEFNLHRKHIEFIVFGYTRRTCYKKKTNTKKNKGLLLRT